MLADALPVRWRTEPAFNVPELIDELADCPLGSARHDLLIALQHARARAERDPWGSPEHVRYAQAVLEIAVEWAMPAVERWAVAWLNAAGAGYLRLRWSSRSRDGRTRRDGLAPSPIYAITADSGRAIIGCESGAVAEWRDDTGLTVHQPSRLPSAVWAVACHDQRVLAVGEHGHVSTRPDTWKVPAPRESLNAAIETATITAAGDVACGDNVGRLLICLAGDSWLPLEPPDDWRAASIAALSFAGQNSVWAVWKSGWVTETRRGPGGSWEWLQAHQPRPIPVTAAAFDRGCRRAVICYADGEVSVLHLGEMTPVRCWPGHSHAIRARSAAWSAGGLLAVSGTGSMIFGAPDREPEQIIGEGAGGRVAFLGEDHLVAAHGREIADWAIHDVGSDVPDPLQSEITAVTVDPLDPGRTVVGTRRGGVLRYDERGLVTKLVSDYGPIGGQIHGLTRSGDDWLVAAHTGAYRLTEDGHVSQLPGPEGTAPYLCHSVAGGGPDGPAPGGAYAANDRVYAVSGGRSLTFASTVRDIRAGADGSVAAIADDGTIRAWDPDGAEWSRPRAAPGRLGRRGARLLAADSDSVTVWNLVSQRQNDPARQVRRFARSGEDARLGELPPGTTAALALDGGGTVAACPDQGVLVAGSPVHDGQLAGVSTRVTAIGASGYRIAAAAGQRIAGYDLMPPIRGAEGSIDVTVTGAAGSCRVTVPGGVQIELDTELVRKFGQASGPRADRELDAAALSELVDAASQIGDQLWRCGLDRALDLARGDNPDRPVRLSWTCDAQTDDLPWELVHPVMAPLGWFAEPPVTSVRTVRRSDDQAGRVPAPEASAPLTRYRMLVLRGTAEELDPSVETYVYTSRRTRLRNVRMLNAEPVRIETRQELDQALREPVDILQIWAHCNRDSAKFSGDFRLGTDELARQLAPRVSRLAIIVGCESGAMARALVAAGVEAVVAMRTKVFSGTIQPLIADLIAFALGGMPIDLAFGRALHAYVLTGQPGAAAVPMLYLADGSTGDLFT